LGLGELVQKLPQNDELRVFLQIWVKNLFVKRIKSVLN
jgi:hypothetical protein